MHWERGARSKRPKIREAALKALRGPRLPLEVAYLWGWYLELRSGRQYAMGDPLPVSWVDLAAWRDLTGRSPYPDEVTALMDIDRAYLYPGKEEDE